MVGIQGSLSYILFNLPLLWYKCAQHFDIWPKKSFCELSKADTVIHMLQMRKESKKFKCLAKGPITNKGRGLEKVYAHYQS